MYCAAHTERPCPVHAPPWAQRAAYTAGPAGPARPWPGCCTGPYTQADTVYTQADTGCTQADTGCTQADTGCTQADTGHRPETHWCRDGVIDGYAACAPHPY